LDIHKPKPVHSVREFLSEIAVVVCGILIALALEQAVEFARAVERVHEGEAQMRTELRKDDGPQFYVRLAQSPCIRGQLDELEADLLAERDRGAPFRARALVTPTFFTWDADAYRQSIASSTLTHMSPTELYNWAGPYTMVEEMNALNLKETGDYNELHAAATAPAHPSEPLRERLLAAIDQARGENDLITVLAGNFVRYAKVAGIELTPEEKRAMLDLEPQKFPACRAIRES